jgi:hypothetical protein
VAIRFLPNDPLAVDVLPVREQPARPEPPGLQAAFSYPSPVAEDLYAIETTEFRFWQCREAALAALETWAALAAPPTVWQSGQRLIPLEHDAGPGWNAHYDRAAIQFLSAETGARKTYPAASTDAVAHEVGHALLDAVRPELWESVYTETASFHEAFADCLALLVGLSDQATRQAILAGPGLRAPNVVESLAEDVAAGILADAGAADPQSVPRRALNTLQWEIPVNLPPFGPPGALTPEAHSFGRVFTGCFYDTISNVFVAQATQDEQTLLAAAQTAGRLLVAAARSAPEVPRFFQAVGRAMDLADETASGGANHAAIRDAFAAHNIAIGSTVMLAPTSGLEGAAPTVDAAGGHALLAAGTRRDLLKRLGARGGRLKVMGQEMGGRSVAKAIHRRSVSLGKLDRRLRGVDVPAVESVLVGASAARAVVLGHLPDARTTVDEVHQFVQTLLQHGKVAQAKGRSKAAARARATREQGFFRLPTHVIRTRGGKPVLDRVRFSCAFSSVFYS